MINQELCKIFPNLEDSLKEIETEYLQTLNNYRKNERLRMSDSTGKVVYIFDEKKMELDDIKMYFVSYINKIPVLSLENILNYKNERWIAIAGFRRYSSISNVFISESGKFTFHVFEENDPIHIWMKEHDNVVEYQWTPGFEIFSSYHELIDKVSKLYDTYWKKCNSKE